VYHRKKVYILITKKYYFLVMVLIIYLLFQDANYQYQCLLKGHSTLKHLGSRILDTKKYCVS